MDTTSQFTTLNVDAFLLNRMAPSSQVSEKDLKQLLGGKKFGQETTETQSDITSYNEDDMRELEEYCKKRGIICGGMAGMSPRAFLHMLKSKVEGKSTYETPQPKKGLIYG